MIEIHLESSVSQRKDYRIAHSVDGFIFIKYQLLASMLYGKQGRSTEEEKIGWGMMAKKDKVWAKNLRTCLMV